MIDWTSTEGLLEGDSEHCAETASFVYVIRDLVADERREARTALSVYRKSDSASMNVYAPAGLGRAKEWCSANERSGGGLFAAYPEEAGRQGAAGALAAQARSPHTDHTQDGPEAQ